MKESTPLLESLTEIGKDLYASNTKVFSITDYVLFSLMLMVSVLIGVYYGCISKRKQNTTAEYILGNKEMSILPVAASLIASNVSGVTVLALPADIYANGTQYAMCFICIIFVGFVLRYIYVPVFIDMKIKSSFEYLEKRFDKKVKLTSSLIYAFSFTLFLPIVIYIPSLAFNQVSGINVHVISLVISIMCIFYTTIGGLRAVVWTDTIQIISIFVGAITVMCLGTASAGGMGNVFQAAGRGGRLIFFDMNPNPFVRSTFWTISVGLSAMWMSNLAANPSVIQRCLSLPNLESVKKCILISCIGFGLINFASCYIGLLIYAEYENCDPVSIGAVQKLDQMLPLYIMNMKNSIPGLPGLFIAGIFAAALSSMSSILNTLSGTIFEDLIKPFLRNPSERKSSNIMKAIVIALGAIELSLVTVIEKLGALMYLTYSLHGVTSGTILGLFTIGMISRKVNTKGVIAGSVISLLFGGSILVGAHLSIKPPSLHFNTAQCFDDPGYSTNITNTWIEHAQSYEEVPLIFRLSFTCYALFGAIVLSIVAYLVSLMTGGCDNIDEGLLAPWFRRKTTKTEGSVIYKAVESK